MNHSVDLPSSLTPFNPARAKVPPKLLAKWAEHTSEMEQMAAEAERGLLEIKKYRLLEEEINSRQITDYEAVVSKCTPFGCFVEIPSLAVSGLVHVSLLSNRFVRFNESDQSLSAPGGGSWHVGDTLRVHVAKVDFRQRRIDFVPVRKGERERGKTGERESGKTGERESGKTGERESGKTGSWKSGKTGGWKKGKGGWR